LAVKINPIPRTPALEASFLPTLRREQAGGGAREGKRGRGGGKS